MLISEYITPVMYVDPNGEFVWIIIGAVIGGIAGAAYSYYKTGEVDWRYVVGGALIGAGAGFIAEAAIAYSTSSAIIAAGEMGASGITTGSTGYGIMQNTEQLSQEIIEINEGYGGFVFNPSVSSILDSSTYYDDPYDQVGSILNGLVKNHVFSNGNKRTAFDVYYLLQGRMGLTSQSSNYIWNLIYEIERNTFDYATQIADKIR